MNNFQVTGRITKDLELRSTSSGKKVLDIPIAINNGKDDVTFLSVLAFNKIAETIEKYCKKGDLLAFEGMIKNHNWDDKNGVKHYSYSFFVNRVEFLSMKKEEKKNEEVVDLPTDDKNTIYTEDIEITDDDLPF